MILEGVKLMLVGMGTVFCFLWLTVLCIQLVSRLTQKQTARELESLVLERKRVAMARKAKKANNRPSSASPVANDTENDIAAIAAAIAAFEADKLRSC
jgi:Na+-transporting methylmalonyl-CoA/oxaloacetate decarboxylase gamma subunit